MKVQAYFGFYIGSEIERCKGAIEEWTRWMKTNVTVTDVFCRGAATKKKYLKLVFFFFYCLWYMQYFLRGCHEVPRSYTLKWACTIALCCVVTQVRQVNCKLFVHADHSGLSCSGGSLMFKTIPHLYHTAFSGWSFPYTLGKHVPSLHLEFAFRIIWLNIQKYPSAL